MGDKKTELFECKEMRLTYNAGVLLRQIADSLTQGRIELADGEARVSVEVSPEATVEVKVTEKVSDKGVKRKLELEMKWLVPAGAGAVQA